MVCNNILEGRYVNLRSATEDDAEFSLGIRQDPELMKFMPILSITVDQQRQWIRKQRVLQGDYFFIVEDKKGQKLGTISLYDVSGKRGHSGRIAIRGNSIQCIDAQILLCNFAFYELKLDEITGDCYEDNIRAIRFSEGYGMKFFPPEKNDEGISVRFGIAKKENYEHCYKKLSSLIYK